jgi:uncharacterized protein Smg (DUF494 family)
MIWSSDRYSSSALLVHNNPTQGQKDNHAVVLFYHRQSTKISTEIEVLGILLYLSNFKDMCCKKRGWVVVNPMALCIERR